MGRIPEDVFAALYTRYPGPSFGDNIGAGIAIGPFPESRRAVFLSILFAADKFQVHPAGGGGIECCRQNGRALSADDADGRDTR